MHLSRTSRLVRFAYWLPWPYSSDGMEGPMKIPYSTNLCRFFWRVTLRVPVLLVLVSILPLVAIVIGVAMMGGVVAWAIAGCTLSSDYQRLSVEYLAAKKRRWCPMNTFGGNKHG